MSETTFWLLIAAIVLAAVAALVVFLLRQMYRECVIEQHLYCAGCDAVDSDDEGCCPVCGRTLSERAGFFCTADSDAKKLIKRYGFTPCKEA